MYDVSDEDELEYNRLQEKIEHEAEKRYLYLKSKTSILFFFTLFVSLWFTLFVVVVVVVLL